MGPQFEEIVTGGLPAGITASDEAFGHRTWSVLGHTYVTKVESEQTYAWLSHDPPATGVPPHVHPGQDEFIYVLDGVYTLYLDGGWTQAGPGDLVRMPKGLPHAYYNRRDEAARSLFWVTPAGRLAQLFAALHELDDPDEVVRLSTAHDVDFLPPGSVEGA